jgi:hypothetical protein
MTHKPADRPQQKRSRRQLRTSRPSTVTATSSSSEKNFKDHRSHEAIEPVAGSFVIVNKPVEIIWICSFAPGNPSTN